MRAAGLNYQTRKLELFETPEPASPGDGEVLFRVHEVGICGTDRELASFDIGYPPRGDTRLMLGHEALGQIVASAAPGFRPGDWVVPSIRRDCPARCRSCAGGRRDLCLTGAAPERGIFGLHGYMAQYAVDRASDLFVIPPPLVDVAVLIEPLSVVEKAVATALRLHVGEPRTALALGAGPIGILAAMVLVLRGLDAAVYSLEPPGHPRAGLVREAGLRYLTTLEGERADVLIEATGSSEAAFAGFRALAPLGVYGILGSPNARGEMPFIDLLVNNQVLFGSVNASPEAFEAAITDLAALDRSVLRRMLHRLPFNRIPGTVSHPPGVKAVHVIGE